ncbi:hypothetical protein [Gilliamella sp. wkB308]|uniref:hypothetical protein n=1 Tax=Gilliamella sp. wkB308 TaxID=3120263 RepID=UPI0011798D1F|nr:hypothetical protein [Gilliamella apicola]
MKNKISYFFIIVLLSSCSNKQLNQENVKVSFFNEKKNIHETAKTMSPIIEDDDSENTYILDTFDIFSHKIILQSDVFLNYQNSYERVFEISLINKLDYVIIEIQNTIGVSAYQLFIRERNNKLEIFKQTGRDRILFTFEIAKDDYDSANASLICLSQKIKPINGIIKIPDDLNFTNENTKDCFACPQQYTTEECLQKKQSGEKFSWKK